MNWCLLVLVFMIPRHCTSKYSSFIASFQSSGEWSENEYLEYKDILPELNMFTVCHWEKTQFFSERFNTIWAYCQHNIENNVTLGCLEAMYTTPNEKGDIKMSLTKFHLRSKGSIEYKQWVMKYKHWHWNHFCFVHPNDSNEIKLYHNGEKIKILPIKKLIVPDHLRSQKVPRYMIAPLLLAKSLIP